MAKGNGYDNHYHARVYQRNFSDGAHPYYIKAIFNKTTGAFIKYDIGNSYFPCFLDQRIHEELFTGAEEELLGQYETKYNMFLNKLYKGEIDFEFFSNWMRLSCLRIPLRYKKSGLDIQTYRNLIHASDNEKSIHRFLLYRHWHIIENQTATRTFLTSDASPIIFNKKINEVNLNHYFDDEIPKGFNFFYPLDKNHLLWITESDSINVSYDRKIITDEYNNFFTTFNALQAVFFDEFVIGEKREIEIIFNELNSKKIINNKHH